MDTKIESADSLENSPQILKEKMEKEIPPSQFPAVSDMIIDAESGGGMVYVKVNGKQEVLELNIEESALDEDKELLEDLIISAVNKGLSKAQAESQNKMNSVTGGMMGGMKIPGL